MQWWKVVGAAAFVGVAATGVLVARAERRHHDYTPEEIHERLRARAAEALEGEALGDEALGGEELAPGDDAEVPAAETLASDLPAPGAQPGETPLGGGGSEAGAPPSEQQAPPVHMRRRLVTQVNRVRTRLGLRRRPTPRRKARAAQA